MAPLATFGDLLRRYRVAAGLTQEVLAERARLSPRTVSDLERGVTNWPYRDTVSLLADALTLTSEDRAILEKARRRPIAPALSRLTKAESRDSDGAAMAMPQRPASPSHLRTFLIADSRTYARILHERGDAAGAELASRFAAIVRAWIAAQAGQMIELRGDEVVVAFGSARQALRAALDLQARVAHATISEPAWPLSLGIGLDAGEAIPADGGYHGAALNLAAQLCSLAAVGEVLASAGVAYLARRTEGLAYVERGEIMVEGLEDPVRVIQALPEDAVSASDTRIFDVDPANVPDQPQGYVASLYRAAQAAASVENWEVALERLQRLLTHKPDHPEAAALARYVRQQQELPELYLKGRDHYDAGRWRAALDYFHQVQQIAGNYKAVFSLIATAQYEIERGEALKRPTSESVPSRIADPAQSPLEAHYKLISKAIVDGRVVPFLGPDINLCGRPAELAWQHGMYLPDNNELALHLAESFGYPWHDMPDLARVSQRLTVMTGTSPLYAALRELYNADYPPTPIHQFLARLPGTLRAGGYSPRYQLIVTTMYDDVLERAFQAAGEPFDTVLYMAEGMHRGQFVHRTPEGETHPIDRPNEYRGLSLDQRTVILKMHGAVDRNDPESDSFVITEDDFIGYLSRIEPTNLMPVTLLAKLRTSHLLFLGYNLCDWNQRVILHRLWGEQKLSAKYRSWSVQRKPQPVDHEFWSLRDVAILPVRLEEYVAVLSQRILELAPSGTRA